ncbi:MAG: PqqD family protein [Proteobacteria bacterium]|nr:PqqD family protein [Pseudomonadota bacterium]
MGAKITVDSCYAPSDDIVAREIEGELIIVPLVSGIGDAEDDLFTLNDTGRAIWDKLDGKKSLNAIIEELSSEYEAPEGEIKQDVMGLMEELLKRRMIVEVVS